MASNTTLNTGAGGDIIATKERTHDGDATKVQVVTLAGVSGTEGSYTFADIGAGAGAESAALRVTLATESLAALETVSVTDGGGSLTVDGTVELGATSLAALETIELGATSLAALESLTTINAVTTVGTITNAVTVVGSAAEDAAASGNPILVGGRYDSSARTLETGDVGALAVNASGQLLVEIAAGAGSGGTSAADGATFTRNTTSITPVGAVVESSAPTLANGDVAGLSQDTSGRLRVRVDAGGVAGQVDDAAFTAGTTEGVAVMGYYSSTRDAIDSGDAGAIALNSRRAQYITADGLVSTVNSSSANLGASAAFTGTAEDVSDYALIQVSVFSSHASATDGLSLQQSSNGTNWDIADTFTIAATTAKVISIQPAAQYFRLVYTNGGTLTTSLRIQTVLKPFASKGSSQRPADATSNENDFEMVSGFLHGYNGTTWDRLRSVNTGYLGVAPHFAGTAASTGTGAAGAQTQRVVTATDSTIGTLTNITNWGNIVDDAAATPATTRVMMSGYFVDDTSTDSADEGDGGFARMTPNRKQIAQPYESEANTWSYAAAAGGLVNTTGVTAKAAAGAGLRNYITAIQVINSHQTTGTEVVVRDGAAGTVLHRGWAAPNAGYAATFPTPLRGTANTLIEIAEVTTTATAGVLVNLQGYVGA